ncbi:hypothetical protein EDD17DRAFT_550847 [Pisolithus thermaeus]|nr:hypothetical protein EDD17DRAFT_550847 [Pisolithus thermaeus]
MFVSSQREMQTAGNYSPLSVARDAQTIQFLQVLPATLMVYDYILSLDDEVEYIWKKRLSFSTAEFIANENTTNMVVTYDFPGLDMWLSCLAYWFVQIILALRLYALYGGSRKVLITIVSGLVVEGSVMTVCVALLTISADNILSNLGFKPWTPPDQLEWSKTPEGHYHRRKCVLLPCEYALFHCIPSRIAHPSC